MVSISDGKLHIYPEAINLVSFAFVVLTLGFLADIGHDRYNILLIVWIAPGMLSTIIVDLLSLCIKCLNKVIQKKHQPDVKNNLEPQPQAAFELHTSSVMGIIKEEANQQRGTTKSETNKNWSDGETKGGKLEMESTRRTVTVQRSVSIRSMSDETRDLNFEEAVALPMSGETNEVTGASSISMTFQTSRQLPSRHFSQQSTDTQGSSQSFSRQSSNARESSHIFSRQSSNARESSHVFSRQSSDARESAHCFSRQSSYKLPHIFARQSSHVGQQRSLKQASQSVTVTAIQSRQSVSARSLPADYTGSVSRQISQEPRSTYSNPERDISQLARCESIISGQSSQASQASKSSNFSLRHLQ